MISKPFLNFQSASRYPRYPLSSFSQSSSYSQSSPYSQSSYLSSASSYSQSSFSPVASPYTPSSQSTESIGSENVFKFPTLIPEQYIVSISKKNVCPSTVNTYKILFVANV